MNVVYYSSDLFAEICCVSLLSLYESNKSVANLDVYIIDDNILEKSKARLNEVADNFNRHISFIALPEQSVAFPGIKMNLGRTYARMLLGSLLPDSVERVISLDSDTIILDSLEELYSVGLGNCAIAGVYDCVGEGIQKKFLKASDDLVYCNAGVFLIDLAEWRREGIENELIGFVQRIYEKQERMYFLEQDLMNLLFEGRMHLLDPKYNLLTSVALFDYREVMKMKRPVRYYSYEQIESAKKTPVIIHATTCFYVRKRIWVDGSDHPYAKVYVALRNRTPWANDSRIPDTRRLTTRIYAAFWHLLPRPISIAFAAFLINHIRPKYASFASKASIQPVA